MEPEGSLLHLQVPATCPYPEPDQCSPCPPTHSASWRSILISTSHLHLDIQSGVYPTSPRLHMSYIILLDLITHITFGVEYR
jgi:hypothetical protein